MSTPFQLTFAHIAPLARRLAHEVPMTDRGLVLQSSTLSEGHLYDIANALLGSYGNIHRNSPSIAKFPLNPGTTEHNSINRIGLVLADHPLNKKAFSEKPFILRLFSKKLSDKEAEQRLRDMASSDLRRAPKIDIEI